LNWFRSYLDNRHFQVKIKDKYSLGRLLRFGIPQGSILGPLLFILYTKDLERIARNCGIQIHMFADDTQLYICYNRDNSQAIIHKLEEFLKC